MTGKTYNPARLTLSCSGCGEVVPCTPQGSSTCECGGLTVERGAIKLTATG